MPKMKVGGLVLLALLPLASAFAPASFVRPAGALAPRSCSSAVSTPGRWPMATAAAATTTAARRSASSPAMGMFGLGWGEIGVIGVIALFFFGPDKLAPLAKEIGKSASGLKEVTDSFAEGMAEAETGVSTDGGNAAIKSAVDQDTVPVADAEKSKAE